MIVTSLRLKVRIGFLGHSDQMKKLDQPEIGFLDEVGQDVELVAVHFAALDGVLEAEDGLVRETDRPGVEGVLGLDQLLPLGRAYHSVHGQGQLQDAR